LTKNYIDHNLDYNIENKKYFTPILNVNNLLWSIIINQSSNLRGIVRRMFWNVQIWEHANLHWGLICLHIEGLIILTQRGYVHNTNHVWDVDELPSLGNIDGFTKQWS
jgi:hypothetical protein